jgi:DNA-binding NarL/FixJ family response regulator
VPRRPPRTRTTVVLAGPDRDFLEAIREVVDASPPFEVVAIADSEQEALSAATSLEPAIVLLERSAGEDGDDTVKRLRSLSNRPAVVVLTSPGENGSAPDHPRGATAYVAKNAELTSIVDVVLAFAVPAGRVG